MCVKSCGLAIVYVTYQSMIEVDETSPTHCYISAAPKTEYRFDIDGATELRVRRIDHKTSERAAKHTDRYV